MKTKWKHRKEPIMSNRELAKRLKKRRYKSWNSKHRRHSRRRRKRRIWNTSKPGRKQKVGKNQKKSRINIMRNFKWKQKGRQRRKYSLKVMPVNGQILNTERGGKIIKKLGIHKSFCDD